MDSRIKNPSFFLIKLLPNPNKQLIELKIANLDLNKKLRDDGILETQGHEPAPSPKSRRHNRQTLGRERTEQE